MPSIRVCTDQKHEKLSRELGLDKLPIIHTTTDWIIDALENGMQSGATSLMVMIPVRVNDRNAMVLAETSLAVFMNAAAALAAAFHEEVTQPGWAVLSPQAKAMLMPPYTEAIRRAIPSASPEQAAEAAEMLLDAFSNNAPPKFFEQP